MVEEGLTDLDHILRERLGALKLHRDRVRAALDRIPREIRAPMTIDPEVIERFGTRMRDNGRNGDVSFRKACIQAIVDRVEVDDDVIRIVGDKTSLEQAIGPEEPIALASVRRFLWRWRTRHDSNV